VTFPSLDILPPFVRLERRNQLPDLIFLHLQLSMARMNRPPLFVVWILLLATAGLLVGLNGCGGGDPPASASGSNGKIQYVVVIFQENRTPDNLFQDPKLIANGADIQQSGIDSLGQVIPLAPIDLANSYDLSHAHSAFLKMYNKGKMNGADQVGVMFCKVPGCPTPHPQFKYVNPSQVQPYFRLAETYTFGDRMFQTNQGPSLPAHQFIISGTSAPAVGSKLFAAENPGNIPNAVGETGCTAPPDETVAMIDPSGNESQFMYPCFEHPTLMDELDDQNISWKYYTPSAGNIWTGPNSIAHLRNGPDWSRNVIIDQNRLFIDVANGELPAVSWVIPTGQASDHALITDGSGPSWVASIVNAIGNSPYWSNTAIFITWDDWGGWYDHVAPQVINSYEYGFRVPLIVVSPYAKPGYISHVTHDFGSILKYIEVNFGLGSLGYADVQADDMSDCFNYSQKPLTFQTIPAKFDAAHFMSDTRPPADPDDD
jgi:phospholipase C